MRTVATALALLLPVAGLAGPFDGRYRPNYDWAESWDCQSVGREGGALEVAGELFHGLDGACTLSDPVEVRGMVGVLYDLTCPGADSETETRIMLLRHDFGIYAISDGLVLDWLRCE